MAIELLNEAGLSLMFSEDQTIKIDYAVNEIGNIETRQGIQSYDFDVALIGTNLEWLGIPSNLSVVSGFTNKRINCTLIQNGLEIARGFTQVTSVNLQENKAICQFFAGNVEWFELAKNLYLDEIDFSEFDHIFDITNLQDSFTNDWTGGFIYPFIDYGRFTDADFVTVLTPYDIITTIDDWFPSVFVRQILRKFGQQTGFEFVGDFIDSPTISNLIIPYSRKDRPKSYDITTRNSVQIAGIRAGFNNQFTTTAGAGYSKFVWSIAPQFLPVVSNWDITNAEYTVTLEGSYVISFSVSAQLSPQTYNGLLEIRLNGVAIAQNFLVNEYGTVSIQVVLQAGDVLTFWINPTLTNTCNFILGIDLLAGGFVDGSLFQLKTTLPHITFAELMKTLANLFGLMFQVNSFTKRITCFTFEELARGVPNAVDWTHKIGNEGELQFQDVVDGYAKTNNFKWKNIESLDTVIAEYNRINNLPFADGFFIIDNDFIETETDIFESKFAPTSMSQAIKGQMYIPTIQIWDGTAYTKNPEIRLLYCAGLYNAKGLVNAGVPTSEPDTYVLIGTVGYTQVPFTYFYKRVMDSSVFSGINGQQDNLLFENLVANDTVGQSLIERFYPAIRKTLNENKLITVPLMLNEVDLQNLDFSLPIYLGYPYYAYFFISKIDSYTDSEAVTTVELVKIA